MVCHRSWCDASASGVFLLAASNALYTVLVAAFRKWWLACLLTVGWLGAEFASVWLLGPTHPISTAINNSLLVVVIVGVSLIWVQGGLRARDAAVLIAAVGIYDFVATGASSLTGELVDRLSTTPLTPVIAWGSTDDPRLAIGLGDVLLAALFPIVQRKTFGQFAGVAALTVSVGAIAILVCLGSAGALGTRCPVLVVLAPLVTIQYLAASYRTPTATISSHGPSKPAGLSN
jgi:hypothetical protein